MRIGALVALLIPIAYLIYILLAAPKPSILAPVQKELASFPCSDLQVSADEGKGTVKVDGYVSRADDIAGVKQRVDRVEGVKSSAVNVQLRIWPHCEVVDILKTHKARNDDGGYGLSVTPSTGHSDRFIEGENIVVKLQQANYDGYLYVDYYTVNGAVAHIYPNAGEPESGRQISSGERFEVGATPTKTWTVCPPLGQELITVIASPTPLYTEPLTEIETAQDYLPRLKQILAANSGNARMAAAYLFMQTEPADGEAKQAALAACNPESAGGDAATEEPTTDASAEESAP